MVGLCTHEINSIYSIWIENGWAHHLPVFPYSEIPYLLIQNRSEIVMVENIGSAEEFLSRNDVCGPCFFRE
jgi:hypothetical protein